MTTTNKYEVDGYFYFKTGRDNVMYTLFYTNTSEFYGDSEGMLDEGIFKRTIKYAHDWLQG